MLSAPFSPKATTTYDLRLDVKAYTLPGSTETPLDDRSTSSSTKEAIIAEFGEDSPMVQVGKCESQYRQFNSNGEVLRGVVDSDDTGVFQINKRYHLADAKNLGYDIETIEGNIKYARHLYDREGLQPWKASRPCWSRS